jgi:hypothetical protein
VILCRYVNVRALRSGGSAEADDQVSTVEGEERSEGKEGRV